MYFCTKKQYENEMFYDILYYRKNSLEVTALKNLRKILSLIAVLALCVGLVACGGAKQTASSSDPTTSSPDEVEIRPPYKGEEEKPKFVDNDHVFEFEKTDFTVTKDYVIVIPAGNSEAKLSAGDLQKFYADNFGFTLKIVTDNTAETEKEILIGKTRRADSAKDMKESDLKVSLKGSKLIFDGGHDVTADMAVGKYIRNVDLKDGKAITFALSTDFTTTPNVEGLGEYKYVWGDEFEMDGFDHTKWAFRLGMTGSPKNKISYQKEVLDVADGRVKIHAISYYDPSDPNVMFMSPYSLATHETMNFVYGYAEIRARVPFFKGAWPSFWGGTATMLYPRDKRWHAEIDVFEIFGTEDEVVPNIHKWYDDYPYEEIYNTDGVRHTTYGHGKNREDKYVLKKYVYENPENLDWEYHLYGYEWTPTELRFYVDGEKYCTMDIVNSWDLEPDMSMFQDPQYSQFNCHVFVDDASYQPNLIHCNEKMLPACYYIDWYRLYQKNDGKSKIWINTEDLSYKYQDRYNPAK